MRRGEGVKKGGFSSKLAEGKVLAIEWARSDRHLIMSTNYIRALG